MKMNDFCKMPAMVLTMPLTAGIVLACWNDIPLIIKIVDLVMMALSLVLGYRLWPLWESLLITSLMAFTGWMLMKDKSDSTAFPSEWEQQSLTAKMLLTAAPVEKGARLRCDVCVIDATDQAWQGRNLQIYIPRDRRAEALLAGDCIMARFIPRLPVSRSAGYDYVSYLRRKGFTACAYIAGYDWQMSDAGKIPFYWKLRTDAIHARDHLVRMYENHGITGDRLALVSALTLGKKDLMDREMRDRFAGAGVAHVLAVSGMHVGIVYSFANAVITLLWNFFSRFLKCPGMPFLKKRIGSITSQISVVALLWVYAFITGLQASVVRSVTMFTLSAGAVCLGRRSQTWNNLFFTAFLMLCMNPSYLFDIGFQMSFLSVAAILLFLPVFEQLLGLDRQMDMSSFFGAVRESLAYRTKSRILGRVWRYMLSSLLISIAAQIGTTPLSVYYFHRFPQLFLLSNLVLVPVAVAVTWTALAFQCMAAIPFVPESVVTAAAALLSAMAGFFTSFAFFVESLPGAVTEGLLPTVGEIFAAYLFLGSLFCSFQKKTYLYTLENMLRQIRNLKYRKYLRSK